MFFLLLCYFSDGVAFGDWFEPLIRSKLRRIYAFRSKIDHSRDNRRRRFQALLPHHDNAHLAEDLSKVSATTLNEIWVENVSAKYIE